MSFIDLLMSGGSFGHYWKKQSKTTTWWPVDDPAPIGIIQQEDVYFGVHPSKISKSSTERTLMHDIEAISCLYADIDSKNHSDSKQAAAEHIKQLAITPSVIIDSGGGYHCYWLLDEPFVLDTSLKFEIAQELQKRWVTFVGGDQAVHDLARILRLPGTLNYKYDPPRPVKIAYMNLNRRYDLKKLESALPTLEHRGDDEDVKSKVPVTPYPNRLTLQEVVDLAQKSKTGRVFTSLWRGNSEGYESASEADLALCCVLAFWTGGDYEKIDKLFRASDRMRGKWERDDYRHGTLIKALGQVSEYYADPGGFLSAGADDEGNAQCVRARCKNDFLFTGAFGWMKNRGDHWARGETAAADLSLMVVRVLKKRRSAAVMGAQEGNEKKCEAIIRASRPTAANVAHCITLLKPMLTVKDSGFDTSLDELNCPNGVLNLRTGTLTSHTLDKRFSYSVGAPYDPDANMDVWITWLLEATGGKQEVVDYLKLAVGYSITGRTREEIMFYIHGPARSGKGIFTETIQAMLGGRPLATEVGMEMFLEKKRPGQQGFDLASLWATRFVAASESKESWWLDSTKIKRWTGGNPISCAFKYKSQFTYKPQFKIWLTSNYPPQMEADDTAGWGRIQLILFPTSHLGVENKRLKELMRSPEVLKGVLRWAVEGAVQWHALPSGGLKAPQVIEMEKEKAWSELDFVKAWVEEEVIITGGEDDRVKNTILHTRYADWCGERGVSVKKLAGFSRALGRLGVGTRLHYTKNGRSLRGRWGIKLRGMSFREQLVSIGDRESRELVQ